MKPLYTILLFFSISCMFSQNNTFGIVEYIVKNNDNFDVRKILNSPGLKRMPTKMKNETMAAMMKTGSFVLYFNGNEAIYKKKGFYRKNES